MLLLLLLLTALLHLLSLPVPRPFLLLLFLLLLPSLFPLPLPLRNEERFSQETVEQAQEEEGSMIERRGDTEEHGELTTTTPTVPHISLLIRATMMVRKMTMIIMMIGGCKLEFSFNLTYICTFHLFPVKIINRPINFQPGPVSRVIRSNQNLTPVTDGTFATSTIISRP